MSKLIDYDKDFYAWAAYNAELLRQGRLSEIDVKHIAEALDNIAKWDKRQLNCYLKVLIAYLLRWQYQPAYRCNQWLCTITEYRLFINDMIDDNPTLQAYLIATAFDIYPDAVQLVSKETNLSGAEFPGHCPYSADLIIDDSFLPG